MNVMVNPRREPWFSEQLPDISPIYMPIFENIFEIRFLKPSDVPKILALQDTVAKNLSRPEIYRIDPIEYIYGHFSGNQNVIGVLVGEELVAYHVVSFPGLRQDNFGWDIHFSKRQLLKTAHFETTAVHPEFRSKHLARKMADIHIEILKHFGFEHVLCTVSPLNYQSLCNVFRQGFFIKGIKEKYYGLRYIMHKKLMPSIVKENHNILYTIWLRQDDLVQQQSLLEQGYYGFDARIADAGIEIAYNFVRRE